MYKFVFVNMKPGNSAWQRLKSNHYRALLHPQGQALKRRGGLGGPRSSREVKGGHYETRQGQTFLMTLKIYRGAGLRFENDMLDVF